MKRTLLVVLIALMAGLLPGASSPAVAGERYVCWYAPVTDPLTGKVVPGMKCRIDGEIHEPGFPGEGPIQVPLVYDLGVVDGVECYYRRSGAPSGWVVFDRNGTLLNFWWDTGNGFVGDAWVDQCTKEPIPGKPPITHVFERLKRYDFVSPTPDIVPNGIGLTGARTWVNVTPPDPLRERINAPGATSSIEIEIRVVAVRIDWGDESVSTIPESQFDLFAPHPDGEVSHPWETKDHYTIAISYEWLARWRVGNGSWRTIDIPDTSTDTPYQVDEIVGRRSG